MVDCRLLLNRPSIRGLNPPNYEHGVQVRAARRFAAALGLLGCVLANCAATDLSSVSTTPLTVSPGDNVGTLPLLQSPVEPPTISPQYLALQLPIADEIAFTLAKEGQIATCMASQGFSYAVPNRADMEHEIQSRGTLTQTFPRSKLNPISDKAPEPTSVDPNAAYLKSLDDSARSAFFLALLGPGIETVDIPMPDGGSVGTTKGGCISDVRTKLFGELSTAVGGEMLAINIGNLAFTKALSAPTVIESQQAWSACLHERGFDYMTFTQARSATSALPQQSSAQLVEADTSCSESTGLYAAFVAAFNTHVEQLSAEQPLLDEYLRRRREVVADVIASR